MYSYRRGLFLKTDLILFSLMTLVWSAPDLCKMLLHHRKVIFDLLLHWADWMHQFFSGNNYILHFSI